MGSTPIVGLKGIVYHPARDGTRGDHNMATRRQSATVDLKVRMKEPLRAKLERVARQRGVSMNAEAVDRLERSFIEAESWGGVAVLNLARLAAAALVQAGQREAQSKNLPPDQWVNDNHCYMAALEFAMKVLLDAQPSKLHTNLKSKKISAQLRRGAAWRHVRDQETERGGAK